MYLPFTHEEFLDVFGKYNSTLWPAVVALWLLTVAGVIALARTRVNPRFLTALLFIHWLWSGGVYHLGYFADINSAARLFGILFITQALLIGWFGLVRARLTFVWRKGRGLQGGLAVLFTIYALVYPFLALAVGLDWPRTPTFGVPCPTTLLTVGLLFSLEPVHLRVLGIIPLVWAIIGGSAAILLGVLPDWALLVGAGVLLLWLVAPRAISGNLRGA
jgi:hypothetical protein